MCFAFMRISCSVSKKHFVVVATVCKFKSGREYATEVEQPSSLVEKLLNIFPINVWGLSHLMRDASLG